VLDGTAASEDSEIRFNTYVAGSNGQRMYLRSGLVVGSPTGGDKGSGTINATAVYDDNTLLTDYVFDWYTDGTIRKEDEQQARIFMSDTNVVGVDYFSEFWKKHRHLPSMPSREEWLASGNMSVGALAQRLWETAELQAIHIDNLNARLKKLEEANG
jgi:hypothetical protein